MKEAWRQLRIAEIYATRVDWMMSGDDDEDTMQERLAEDLESFEQEFRNKDWGLLYEDEEQKMMGMGDDDTAKAVGGNGFAMRRRG